VSKPVLREALESFTKLLSPFAPYLAQELWDELGHTDDLLRVRWPSFDPVLAKEDELEIPVQINGRLRSKILAREGMPQDELGELALADPRIAQMIKAHKVLKTIVVPNKLVNIVISEHTR
jgi:leucyl-tRNA synthetase